MHYSDIAIGDSSIAFFLQQTPPGDVVSATETASSTVVQLVNDFYAQLPLIGVGLIVFLIFVGIAFIVRRVITASLLKAKVDEMLASLISRMVNVLIIVIGLFVSATVIVPGISPGDLVTGLGIGSVALGFAFKDVLQNLLSGFLILLYRPFKIGDQIKVTDFEGVVEEITVRSTNITTSDGERVVIPNSSMFMESVVVRTAFPVRRSKAIVGVAYGEDINKARSVLLEVLKNTEGVVSTPAPDVDVKELADSSVNFELLFWTDSKQKEARLASDRVVADAKIALDEAGIEIPFPHRVLVGLPTQNHPEPRN